MFLTVSNLFYFLLSQQLDQLDSLTRRSLKQKINAAGRVAKMQQQTLSPLDPRQKVFDVMNVDHRNNNPADLQSSDHLLSKSQSEIVYGDVRKEKLIVMQQQQQQQFAPDIRKGT